MTASESGSGEPVPAPTCLCGSQPPVDCPVHALTEAPGPWDLMGALHGKVHIDLPGGRAAKSVKVPRPSVSGGVVSSPGEPDAIKRLRYRWALIREKVYGSYREELDAALESVSQELEGLRTCYRCHGQGYNETWSLDVSGNQYCTTCACGDGTAQGLCRSLEKESARLRGELDALRQQLGEPSREPTLEEIVRQTELIISAEFRLPASSDHEIAALVDLVRARLSSPEAPR